MCYLRLVEDLLLPERCVLCARPLFAIRCGCYPLCAECRGRLTLLAEPRCGHCGTPLMAEIDTCLDCRKRPHGFVSHRSLFEYDQDVAELLRCFKGTGVRSLAALFAALLYEEWRGNFPGSVVVPVPGHPRSAYRRGWDQAVELCRAMRRCGGLEVCHALRRGRSHRQKQLGFAARQTNLRGRIAVTRAADALCGRTATLVDDVFTTGATLDACCDTLLRHGVTEVYALTVAMDL